jgi:hypothetical protein
MNSELLLKRACQQAFSYNVAAHPNDQIMNLQGMVTAPMRLWLGAAVAALRFDGRCVVG